jgi:hypothetical protein
LKLLKFFLRHGAGEAGLTCAVKFD